MPFSVLAKLTLHVIYDNNEAQLWKQASSCRRFSRMNLIQTIQGLEVCGEKCVLVVLAFLDYENAFDNKEWMNT